MKEMVPENMLLERSTVITLVGNRGIGPVNLFVAKSIQRRSLIFFERSGTFPPISLFKNVNPGNCSQNQLGTSLESPETEKSSSEIYNSLNDDNRKRSGTDPVILFQDKSRRTRLGSSPTAPGMDSFNLLRPSLSSLKDANFATISVSEPPMYSRECDTHDKLFIISGSCPSRLLEDSCNNFKSLLLPRHLGKPPPSIINVTYGKVSQLMKTRNPLKLKSRVFKLERSPSLGTVVKSSPIQDKLRYSNLLRVPRKSGLILPINGAMAADALGPEGPRRSSLMTLLNIDQSTDKDQMRKI
uniref:Uncharacterized protein n=1 Tax=Solanum lycopersicum TaxID=4081 RepID=A0A3Q7HFG7_SOLLC